MLKTTINQERVTFVQADDAESLASRLGIAPDTDLTQIVLLRVKNALKALPKTC
jgi:hypothetical protein